MSSLYLIFLLILNLAFYVVLFAFVLRMLFQLFRANAQNPIALHIGSVTNVVVLPLREYLPRTRYVDLSTFVCWLAIDLIKYTVMIFLANHSHLSFMQYLILIPADLLMQISTVIFYATLFYAIINFVAPGLQSVGMDTLKILSEPALAQARKLISPRAGFDFAPIIVLLVTKFIEIAITQYIPAGYFF